MTENANPSPAIVPLEERVAEALAQGCKTVLDETDVDNVVKAVMPVLRSFGWQEFDRGLERGDLFARQRIAQRLGLGDLA